MITMHIWFENAHQAREAADALIGEGFSRERIRLGSAPVQTAASTGDAAADGPRDGEPLDRIAPAPLATGMASSGAGLGAGAGVIMGGVTPGAINTVQGESLSWKGDAPRIDDKGDVVLSAGSTDDTRPHAPVDGDGDASLTISTRDAQEREQVQRTIGRFTVVRVEES
jgi:hypothetical protein